MELTAKQTAFMVDEFGITAEELVQSSYDDIKEIREKCFDIEVEEAAAADNENREISIRGETAAEIVDRIKVYLKSQKLANV